MKKAYSPKLRVLSVFANTRGFGFVVLEGSRSLVDWGARDVSGKIDKNAECLRKISRLIDEYQPSVIVLEDYEGEGSKRGARTADLIEEIATLAGERKIKTKRFSRAMIRERYASTRAYNKEEIARVLAKQLPALERYLPPERKIWMPEDPRMSIFDAAALAMTFFYKSQKITQDPLKFNRSPKKPKKSE